MIQVVFSNSFVKRFNSLPEDFRLEIARKIEFFKDVRNHKQLKVHKLHGKLKTRYSFSVDYRVRIVFSYLTRNEVILHSVGDHQIYE